MIPLRDNIPRVHTPVAVWCILVANVLAFLYESGLDPAGLFEFTHLYGVVPARFFHPDWALSMGFPPGGYSSLVTHMFLHGGWMHLIMNMWTMWVFADNIEDVMGPARFVAFYLVCGFAALGLHMVFNADSTMPVIGASGAIAGVMGAYFLLYPHAKVLTLIPIIIIPYFIELPAVLFLGIWFLIQVWSGMTTLGDSQGGGVAWWAHIGGFAAGMLLLPLFRRNERCHYCHGRRSEDWPG
mgnify:CR=1 FL=1